jgi:two-component sensor histidine kinase
VLKPYAHAATSLRGPAVRVGEHATNTIALVFHELATNAAKYGALSTEAGTVSVEWKTEDGQLELDWNEAGGPPIETEPGESGFGTSLVANTITRHGGTIVNTWCRGGAHVCITLPLSSLTH